MCSHCVVKQYINNGIYLSIKDLCLTVLVSYRNHSAAKVNTSLSILFTLSVPNLSLISNKPDYLMAQMRIFSALLRQQYFINS